MRWSIRYQLLIPLLMLLVGIGGISTWTAMASAQRARHQIESQVRNVARTLSEANIPVAPNWLTEMRGLTGAEYLLVQSDGRTNQTSGLIGDTGELPPQIPIMDDWKTLRLSSQIQVGRTSYLGCGVSLRQPGGGVLYIFYPEASWRDALWEAVRPSLVLGGFMGFASIILAVAMGRTFGRRIQEMERRTRGIASGDFSPMPLPRLNDEFQDLAGSINDMAHQLARLQETMQKSERLRLLGQVSGGLAHQLRNGVAGARLALQVHARELNGQADSEAIQVALRQLQLLEAHLQRFLNLGKVGEQGRQTCFVESLLDEAVNLLRPKSRHANIDLIWEKPEPHLSVLGNADQLSQVFLNLIGNALDAAGPGGRVQVQIRSVTDDTHEGNATFCRVDIIDSGAGPPATIADRIFEPFVTGKPDGVGLGLALARQVTEVHGGRIGWIRESDQTRFFVDLPLQHSLNGTTIHPTTNASILDEKTR